MSVREIRRMVDEHAQVLNVSVPARVLRLLARADDQRSNRLTFHEVQPGEPVRPILGTVVSVSPNVNLLKALKLEDNPIGRGLLGSLLRRKYGLVRVREEADEDRHCREFQIYTEQSLIAEMGLRQDTSVVATVRIHVIPGRNSIWIAEAMERA